VRGNCVSASSAQSDLAFCVQCHIDPVNAKINNVLKALLLEVHAREQEIVLLFCFPLFFCSVFQFCLSDNKNVSKMFIRWCLLLKQCAFLLLEKSIPSVSVEPDCLALQAQLKESDFGSARNP